jgi:hypothetical protein
MKNGRMIYLIALALVLGLSGCVQPQPTPPLTKACRCTLDIQFLLVEVVDQHERPVTGLEITVINKHTGQAYDMARSRTMQEAIPDGWYVVFSDHLAVCRRDFFSATPICGKLWANSNDPMH